MYKELSKITKWYKVCVMFNNLDISIKVGNTIRNENHDIVKHIIITEDEILYITESNDVILVITLEVVKAFTVKELECYISDTFI